MTLEEFAGVDRDRVDLKTGERLSHESYYGRCVEMIGSDSVKRLIPFSAVQIAKAAQEDKNLNNTSPFRRGTEPPDSAATVPEVPRSLEEVSPICS